MIKFNDGMSKIILHDTTMKVPIFNSLFSENEKFYSSSQLDINKLNNLDFRKVDNKRFPLIKILKQIPKECSLFETYRLS